MDRKNYDEITLAARKKRTIMSSIVIFLFIPATILGSLGMKGNGKYMVVSLLILLYTMVPFFMIFEKRKPKAREIVLIAMMTAITTFAHMFFHITIPIQIGTAMVVISGVSMGPEAGFLVGALSRFVCNFYMGQGPWTPWQMFSWGLLGFLAGLTFNKAMVENSFEALESRGEKKKITSNLKTFRLVMEPVISILVGILIGYIGYLLFPGEETTFFGWRVYAFGLMGLIVGAFLQKNKLPVDHVTLTGFTFFTTVILYGGIMNIAAMITTSSLPNAEISWESLKLLYISGLPYDLTHGVVAAICIMVIGKPMINKIERVKIKYGIYR